MSRLIKVALVGRPNVGKSALFNAIAKKRVAIVDEVEGVTRDRTYVRTDFFGFPFEIIDTGGMSAKGALFAAEIQRQAEIAIAEADSIILVVDAEVGALERDVDVAKILHRSKKPLCLAVNKIDNPQGADERIHPFASLGIRPMVAVSAVHGFHIAELVEASLRSFDKTIIPEITPEGCSKIAIIGRPNVGKSELLNALVDDERAIVSPIAGTTRDAIDTMVHRGDHDYLFIDTAGIRKRGKEKEAVGKFAYLRTIQAIERADICLVLIDCLQGMTQEEKKMVRLLEEMGKGCILLFNKWDLAHGFRMEHALKGFEQELPFFQYSPKLIISAKTRRNLDKLFPLIDEVAGAFNKRVSTHALNKCLIGAIQKLHPPVIKGRRLRIYYMAQVETAPPHFVLFVNSSTLMDESWKKYLLHTIRHAFGFAGIPLKFTMRGKIVQQRKRESARAHSERHIDRDVAIIEDDFDDDALE